MIKTRMLSLILGLGLSGCATIQAGIPTPETPRQVALVANTSVEALYKSLANTYCPDPPECVLGSITKDQTIQLRKQLREVEVFLDAANTAILAGNETQASTILTTVNSMLLQVKKSLTQYQSPLLDLQKKGL